MHTKLTLLIVILVIIGMSLLTHRLSVKSRRKNTPNVIRRFKTEVKPDLDKSLAHTRLDKGTDLLMAKQAVASLGIWMLQFRYADIGMIDGEIGSTLFEYVHKMQRPIAICKRIPFWSSYVICIHDSLQEILNYRANVKYHEDLLKNTKKKGGLECFIKAQLKRLLHIFANML